MEDLQGNIISSWRHALKFKPVSRGTQRQEQVVQPEKIAVVREKYSHFRVPFTGPEKLLLSYEINSHSGAIMAKMVDPETGKTIREIEVKPEVRMFYEKGSFFESMA